MRVLLFTVNIINSCYYEEGQHRDSVLPFAVIITALLRSIVVTFAATRIAQCRVHCQQTETIITKNTSFLTTLNVNVEILLTDQLLSIKPER